MEEGIIIMNGFRRTGIFVLCALMCLMLSGCGKKKPQEEEERNYIGNVTQDTITIFGDGSIQEIACDDYSNVSFDYSELEQYIKDSIDEYDQNNGQDKITFLQYSNLDGVVRTAIRYSDIDVYNDFNKTAYRISDYDAAACDSVAQKAVEAELDAVPEEDTEQDISSMSAEELAEAGLSPEDIQQEEAVETITQEAVLATFTDASGGGEVNSAQVGENATGGTLQMIFVDSEIYLSIPDADILYVNGHASLQDAHNAHTDGKGTAIIIYSNINY